MQIAGPFWMIRPTSSTLHSEWRWCYLWLNENGKIVAYDWQ